MTRHGSRTPRGGGYAPAKVATGQDRGGQTGGRSSRLKNHPHPCLSPAYGQGFFVTAKSTKDRSIILWAYCHTDFSIIGFGAMAMDSALAIKRSPR